MNAKFFVFIRKILSPKAWHQENARNSLIFISRRLPWLAPLFAAELRKNERRIARPTRGEMARDCCKAGRIGHAEKLSQKKADARPY
jgi:hypothetical protein